MRPPWPTSSKPESEPLLFPGRCSTILSYLGVSRRCSLVITALHWWKRSGLAKWG